MQTFNGIDLARFARICAAVKSKTGFTISGSSGQVSGKGITVGWSYDGVSVLVLTVIKRSWYDPSLATIEADLAGLVAGSVNMQNYKTGKLPVKYDLRNLRMGKYLIAQLPPPPASCTSLQRVYAALKQPDPSVLFPMDGNDQYGDCTFAAKAHAVTLYRGLVGQSDIMAGPQVVNSYLAFTGGQDTGCTGLAVLNDWRQNAFDGDKIIAYVSIVPTDHQAVMHAIHLFGGVYLGFQVQQGAQDDFDAGRVWTPGPLTGDGHAGFAAAYDRTGWAVLTWGATQGGTWAWWDECVAEAYCILPPEAAQPGFCPGFDMAQLQTDLALVTA